MEYMNLKTESGTIKKHILEEDFENLMVSLKSYGTR